MGTVHTFQRCRSLGIAIALAFFNSFSPTMGAEELTYSDARHELLKQTETIRIYGVKISEGNNPEGYVAIQPSGMPTAGKDFRRCTKRIWYLPESEIRSVDTVSDFKCDGYPVYEFYLNKGAVPLEESYGPVTGLEGPGLSRVQVQSTCGSPPPVVPYIGDFQPNPTSTHPGGGAVCRCPPFFLGNCNAPPPTGQPYLICTGRCSSVLFPPFEVNCGFYPIDQFTIPSASG